MAKTAKIKKAKKTLEVWFKEQLTVSEKKRILDDVTQNLKISVTTFYRRLKFPNQFNTVERDYFCKVAGIKTTDFFHA